MRLTALLFSLLAIGCSRTYTFNVSVKNSTDSPLTVGLVKYGGPAEPKWASPEDIAIGHPERPELRWGGLLPTGKIADIHQEGTFANGSSAFLRIYSGEHSSGELLAMSHKDSGRADAPIPPGNSAFDVRWVSGKLVVTRVPVAVSGTR